MQESLAKAVRSAKIEKHVACHTLRHSFTTYLLEDGSDIRTIQALLGHKDLKTTMRHTHVMQRGPTGTRSPLDAAFTDIGDPNERLGLSTPQWTRTIRTIFNVDAVAYGRCRQLVTLRARSNGSAV